MEDIIQLSHICKTYFPGTEQEVRALDDVTLTIPAGSFCAVQGASGAGKSTLLHIIGLLDTPDQGAYSLLGRQVSSLGDAALSQLRNAYFGFVLQDFALIPGRTVYENVAIPLIFGDARACEIKPRVREVLARVGVPDLEKRYPNELSGGQKQRVAIARALVNRPQAILADEPTGALDSKTGREIMECFRQVNESGITVIIVTHDGMVASYCRRLLRLEDGRLTYDGATPAG